MTFVREQNRLGPRNHLLNPAAIKLARTVRGPCISEVVAVISDRLPIYQIHRTFQHDRVLAGAEPRNSSEPPSRVISILRTLWRIGTTLRSLEIMTTPVFALEASHSPR